jgi:hypothetical protein
LSLPHRIRAQDILAAPGAGFLAQKSQSITEPSEG